MDIGTLRRRSGRSSRRGAGRTPLADGDSGRSPGRRSRRRRRGQDSGSARAVVHAQRRANPPQLRLGAVVNVDLRTSLSDDDDGADGHDGSAYSDEDEFPKTDVGIVRYVGSLPDNMGTWVGVELSGPYGDTDGSYDRTVFFKCTPDHGVFVRPSMISPGFGTSGRATPRNSRAFWAVEPTGPVPREPIQSNSRTTTVIYPAPTPADVGPAEGDPRTTQSQPPPRVDVGGTPSGSTAEPPQEAASHVLTLDEIPDHARVSAAVRHMGRVRYKGTTSFADGVWVGVELFSPQGKNNGSVMGVRYFSCPDRHGVFVRLSDIKLAEEALNLGPAAARLRDRVHMPTIGSGATAMFASQIADAVDLEVFQPAVHPDVLSKSVGHFMARLNNAPSASDVRDLHAAVRHHASSVPSDGWIAEFVSQGAFYTLVGVLETLSPADDGPTELEVLKCVGTLYELERVRAVGTADDTLGVLWKCMLEHDDAVKKEATDVLLGISLVDARARDFVARLMGLANAASASGTGAGATTGAEVPPAADTSVAGIFDSILSDVSVVKQDFASFVHGLHEASPEAQAKGLMLVNVMVATAGSSAERADVRAQLEKAGLGELVAALDTDDASPIIRKEIDDYRRTKEADRQDQFFGDVDLMSAPMIAEFLERKLGRTSLGAPFLAAMQNLAQLPSQATPDNVRLWTEAAERILAPAPTVAPSLEASATGSEPGEALAATKRILELEAQVAALQEEIVGAKAEADDLRKEKDSLVAAAGEPSAAQAEIESLTGEHRATVSDLRSALQAANRFIAEQASNHQRRFDDSVRKLKEAYRHAHVGAVQARTILAVRHQVQEQRLEQSKADREREVANLSRQISQLKLEAANATLVASNQGVVAGDPAPPPDSAVGTPAPPPAPAPDAIAEPAPSPRPIDTSAPPPPPPSNLADDPALDAVIENPEIRRQKEGITELIPYEEGKAASSPAEDEAFGGPHYVASEEMTKSNIANGKERKLRDSTVFASLHPGSIDLTAYYDEAQRLFPKRKRARVLAVVDKTGPGHLLDADPETANQANSIYTFLSAHRVTPEQVRDAVMSADLAFCTPERLSLIERNIPLEKSEATVQAWVDAGGDASALANMEKYVLVMGPSQIPHLRERLELMAGMHELEGAVKEVSDRMIVFRGALGELQSPDFLRFMEYVMGVMSFVNGRRETVVTNKGFRALAKRAATDPDERLGMIGFITRVVMENERAVLAFAMDTQYLSPAAETTPKKISADLAAVKKRVADNEATLSSIFADDARLQAAVGPYLAEMGATLDHLEPDANALVDEYEAVRSNYIGMKDSSPERSDFLAIYSKVFAKVRNEYKRLRRALLVGEGGDDGDDDDGDAVGGSDGAPTPRAALAEFQARN